jgi:hypothetical protein
MKGVIFRLVRFGLVLFGSLSLCACQSMEDKGYVRNPYGDWIKPGQRYFGDSAHRNDTREILVQTIPRGAYIERDNEYIGVAPISVTVQTDSDGDLRDWHTIRATDTPTGAWSQKRLSRMQPAPEKMLIDIRPYLSPPKPFGTGP